MSLSDMVSFFITNVNPQGQKSTNFNYIYNKYLYVIFKRFPLAVPLGLSRPMR